MSLVSPAGLPGAGGPVGEVAVVAATGVGFGTGPALAVVGLVLGVGAIGFAAAFAYMYARYRVFTRGLRGTGVLVEVRPTRLFEQRSVVERPTVRVVVATAAVPRGVLTDQKLPAGEYHPGQVVPVVQHPSRPDRLYVDRPDLERSAGTVFAPLVVLLLLPVIATLGIRQLLAGG